MSSAAGSGNKKSNLVQEDLEAYDPYAGFELNNACTEVSWPEWNDAELNMEAWDEGRVVKGTAAGAKNAPADAVAPRAVFDDPAPPNLPPPISNYVRLWKRPQDVFTDADLTVFDPSNIDFELHMPSPLSSECKFFKALIEEITVLQFYAYKYGFQVEMETANFLSNTQGEVWRPWHLVYALCKAGKGQVHKPLYCPYGKYVVRLFYLGAWRKFMVDDKIPCDAEGKCMLPVSQVSGELWPIILTKALLKILSLTPSSDFFSTDFPFVSSFTAWTHHHITSLNKSHDQIWRRLLALTPQFKQPETVESGVNTKLESSKISSAKDTTQTDRFCFLFANLIGLEENVPTFCNVAVTMTRDCPLVKVNKREETKPWKKIRWIYWAKEKGLWMDENQLPPYRRLQIITLFQEIIDELAPDPKLEAAMYDIPVEENSGVNEEILSGEDKPFEPEQWCDFNSFMKYLIGIDVFFKPSIFTYSFKVTCFKGKVAEVSQGAKTATKSLPPPPPQNLFLFPIVLRGTFNEPGFLFCEALNGIFLCFSLSVYPQENKKCCGYLDADQPKILKVGHASLVIEAFDWTSVQQGEILGIVTTVGYSSVILNLKPGRHILKVWISSDSPYVLDIFSNVSVTVGKSIKIRNLMMDESQQILNYINNVSNVFIALTQKFGKPDFPAGLRDFYETILKPKNDIIERYHKTLDEFIENFIQCILLTLQDLIPSVDEVMVMMLALRSLFIDPTLQCDLDLEGITPSIYGGNAAKKSVPKKAPVYTKERTLSEILNTISIPDDISKVVMIQKVFRGYRVRLLWKCQTPARKEYKFFTERLKKICDVMFIPQKRDLEVGKLLRRVVMRRPTLLTTFRFHRDFFNVIQVEEFTGKILNVEPFAWVPMARFLVGTHFSELVPCSFYLNCNLEQSVVQGFDNDSGAEIFRVANTVSPHYYQSNVKGYTIFVFGWNEANVKTVNWKLQMVKMKYVQSLHLCNLLMNPICTPYTMPTLDAFDIKNFYVPNSKFRILRCLIKIQKRTLLTLRLSMSYLDVEFKVIITLGEKFSDPNFGTEACGSDKVIADLTSTNGAVIVPMLILEYVENPYCGESFQETNSTVYVLEAYVLNNSWPLTKQEWGLVEPIRVNGENWKDSTVSFLNKKIGSSESRRKLLRSSRKSVNEQKIENPFWFLQALYDSSASDSVESVVIEEDKSYAESIRTMKMYWEEKDPGRRRRGRELRMKFIYMMYLEDRRNRMFGEGYMGEDDGGFTLDEQTVIDQLSSFSYLTNDPSTIRYTYSPRILPVMPLAELLCKYRVISEFSSTVDDEYKEDTKGIQSMDNSSDFSKIFNDSKDSLENERQDYLKQCLHYRSVLADCMNEKQKLSNRLMEQAYEARSKFIERILG